MDVVKEARVVALRCTLPVAPASPAASIAPAPAASPSPAGMVSQAALVELATESGLKGWGEVQAGGRVPAVVGAILSQLKPMLIGRDPAGHRSLIKELRDAAYTWGRRGLPVGVIGGIETALLDVRARQLGVPYYQLLGGAVRDRLRVYASGGQDRSPRHIEQELAGYMSAGFTAVKVRVGYDPSEDVRFVSLVREIIGEEMGLMVDAGQQYRADPWPLPTAIHVARSLEPFRLTWLEDPYPVNDLAGLRRLRASCNVPISGGESMATFWEARQLIESEAIDVFQPDVSFIGGPTEYRKAVDFASAHGIPVADHTWGTGISVMANIHAQFATENVLAAEMPALPNPIREAFFTQPLVDRGYVPLPVKPGLGVELTPETEARFGYAW